MSEVLIKEVRKALSGKSGRLEDQELESLAQEITKLGFKIGFARSYAYGPTMMKHLCDALEEAEHKLAEIQAISTRH